MYIIMYYELHKSGLNSHTNMACNVSGLNGSLGYIYLLTPMSVYVRTYVHMQELHAQKMRDLEQRLTQQYEREFQERLALHINALVVQQKEAVLEMQRVHDDQINSLRRKFTKPAKLNLELEHSHRTIAVGIVHTAVVWCTVQCIVHIQRTSPYGRPVYIIHAHIAACVLLSCVYCIMLFHPLKCGHP